MEEDKLTSAFKRIGSRLRLSARKLTGTTDDADDVLQEAFFRLWQRRADINTEEQAERLLTTTVRNAGIDILRQRVHFSDSSIPDTPDESSEEQQDDLLGEVTTLINNTLTLEQRQIIYERDRFGWDISDIAHKHGLSEGNVRMILSRSRKRIRELYRQRKNNEI